MSDPHFNGAGIHLTPITKEGILEVHSDFNLYPQYNMYRRVNLFVYLNDDWHGYGGDLELWDRNMTGCQKRYKPLINRMTVFSTTDFTFHGHPEPMKGPNNRARKSVAMYYYSKHAPAVTDCQEPKCSLHSTLWQNVKRKGKFCTL